MEVGPSDNYGGFEIEHFKPRRQFRSQVNHYPNLLWTCHACNRAKGDIWPSDAELARGMRFVDPSSEALGAHLELNGERIQAVGGSPAGQYMIDEIDLDAQLHKERRRVRATLVKRFATLEATLEVLREMLRKQPHIKDVDSKLADAEVELESLRTEITERRVPWDPPGGCVCVAGAPTAKRRLTRRQRKEQRAKLAAQQSIPRPGAR